MSSDISELARRIKQAQHRQHRALDAALARIGTTLVQWDALRAIGKMQGASAHDLAVATFQTDQAFGTLAQRLLAHGLIERKSGLGRRIDHSLTQAGRTILERGSEVMDRVRAELFAPLAPSEQDQLAGLLAKLMAGDQN